MILRLGILLSSIVLVFSVQLGDTSSYCVQRSTQGDQIAATCPVNSTTLIKQCPNDSQVFRIEKGCCQSNQYFSDRCDFYLASEPINISSRVPVVFINETYIHIVQNWSLEKEKANIYHILDNSSSYNTECFASSIMNINSSEEETLKLRWNENPTAGVKVELNESTSHPSGVFKLTLNCTNASNITNAEKQCLYFRLVHDLSNHTGTEFSAKEIMGTCPVNISNNSNTSFPSTTVTSMTAGTTSATEELSILLKYDGLFTYVVIGAGLGVGLLLVFIIMLCVLMGCIAKRRRKRAQRKHQLETAPSIRRNRPRNFETSRNMSYSLPNYNEEQTGHIEYIGVKVHTKVDLEESQSLEEPQPFPQLQPINVEIPLVPTIEMAPEKDEEVTFDTFKRSRNGPKQTQPDLQIMDNIQQGYYESVRPTIKSTDEDALSENYNILTRGSSQKSNTLTKSKSDYSQLNEASSILNPYSQVTPSSRTRPLSPSPVPPPLPSMELLRPRTRQDILTSSWSRPQEMDKVVSQSTPELLEMYDSPTELAFTPARPPRPIKRARGRYIIGEGDSEVIYDIPPIRKISDDMSIGSYVDMQSQFYML